jgi:hypothetical protein
MQKNGKHYQPAGLISVQESEIRTEKAQETSSCADEELS